MNFLSSPVCSASFPVLWSLLHRTVTAQCLPHVCHKWSSSIVWNSPALASGTVYSTNAFGIVIKDKIRIAWHQYTGWSFQIRRLQFWVSADGSIALPLLLQHLLLSATHELCLQRAFWCWVVSHWVSSGVRELKDKWLQMNFCCADYDWTDAHG